MINVSMLIANFPRQEEIADELIFSLAKGNREALKIIYEKSINALYAYVLSLTKNKFDTEDVLQETYVSIAENADHRMLLESAMEILEEEERQILFLHAVAGWKNREIAEYLGKNLNTVLSKYQRSIKKLQEHLGKDE